MSNKNKILIIGASSYIGKRLIRSLDKERIIATYNHNAIKNGIYFNAEKMDLSSIPINMHEISHAIILFGDTNPETCYRNRQYSNTINVLKTKRIIDFLSIYDIKIIFTSTEFVFDGIKGDYTETDAPNPILVYGEQKLEIEEYIPKILKDFTILRLSKVYGDDINDNTLFTSWYKELLSEPKSITCAYDQFFSPIYINDVIKSIIAVIKYNLCGLYHVAGPVAQSRLEFLELLLNKITMRKRIRTKIKTCSIHDFNLEEKRPLNVSMNANKIIKESRIILTNPSHICELLTGRI